jgi:hypothetical protein
MATRQDVRLTIRREHDTEDWWRYEVVVGTVFDSKPARFEVWGGLYGSYAGFDHAVCSLCGNELDHWREAYAHLAEGHASSGGPCRYAPSEDMQMVLRMLRQQLTITERGLSIVLARVATYLPAGWFLEWVFGPPQVLWGGIWPANEEVK